MKVAVFGDAHGNLDMMYHIASGLAADVILQVGDFETVRDDSDLKMFPSPPKYRTVKDFAKFHKEGAVPIQTYFIGGNHEAFGVLGQFPDGGEILRGLHYLGRAGVVEIGGKMVGGLTGSFSDRYFNATPDKRATLRGQQYIHRSDLEKLRGKSLDILLMHDWPFRAQFEQSGEERVVVGGQPNALDAFIREERPKKVFCGHVHVPYRFSLGESDVVCLGSIQRGRGAYELLEW